MVYIFSWNRSVFKLTYRKYQGDQQQTEPDSTATDDNVGNENGSAAVTGDITEEIRKAKEVAQALAGKDVSI